MKRKRVQMVAMVLLTMVICGVMITDLSVRNAKAVETALSWGSKGSKVSEVQRKLKQWGYYDGPVDGIFGTKTSLVVRSFQRKNGLTADGVVGDRTAAALGISLGGKAAAYQSSKGGGGNRGDIYLLARVVYGEARGEPYIGKVAVAAVVLNRVDDPKFPNTISGVVYQPLAFTAVADGQINLAPDEESLRAARDAMNGWDPTYGATFYYNPAKTTSKWIYSRPVHITIGKHKFAK